MQTADEDFLANAPGAPLTPEQKRAYLTAITYKQYLQDHVGVNDEAFHGEYWRGSGGLLGAGGQAVSAADCWILGRPGLPGRRRTRRHRGRRARRHRPDAVPGLALDEQHPDAGVA